MTTYSQGEKRSTWISVTPAADAQDEAGRQDQHIQDQDVLEPFGIGQVQQEIGGHHHGKGRESK